ncbi:MAG: site-2 protease family protein [Micromonosporaceae bacterium]
MRQTLRLGRIAGIPVGVHWSVLVIMVLLAQGLALTILPATAGGLPAVTYWAVGVLVPIVFLLALLAHELSHALVARRYGIQVRRITLWLLGGVAELEGEPPHARADLLIALAGPAMSLVAAAVFGGATLLFAGVQAPPLLIAALGWLAVVNAVLAVFNLLPGAPLDGGRALRAAVWWIRGDRGAAQRVASRAGVILGLLLIFAGVAQVLIARNLGGIWLALVGWFLTMAARAENIGTRLREVLGDLRVGDIMSTPPVYGSSSQTVDDFVNSVARRNPHPAYPVLTPEGQLTGVVTLAGLAEVAEPERSAVRLDAVQVPRSEVTVLDPAAPLAENAAALLADGQRLAAVVSDGHLVGVVTAGDVNRTIEMASLQGPAGRRPPWETGRPPQAGPPWESGPPRAAGPPSGDGGR